MKKIEITQDNFYLGTKCRFKGCKRPKRPADFISYDKYYELEREIISSEYWYGEDKKGKYVIRSSEHWSKSNHKIFSVGKIASCYWWLVTNGKNYFIREDRYFKSFCGKAYFTDFVKNSKI